ncbi:carbohydrate ABC transporter membrane protein 2 (CUT1 family) [Hydrogenispora ethanolica]|jgi:putative aldouronate transport system permease protein|uniref:Carbohydrate ABC transporter membrane protein 2 (CUT1 family) n=1 Tax=Hydrogenispora ethanolica TaxID=1082276 RepID=A0A4R1RTZ7_HYDET|nr:carbohydrate ABC transporter permease [Hydrogenispora ethanolica]TCL70028.1 carbohydrate ABC transporter membrane protein 2 (CUT1 family) [Hydrogenispora ethanolica]
MGKQTKTELNRLNSISPKSNFILNAILLCYSLLCIVPLLLVIAVSFTDERMLAINGYSFWPQKLSAFAYQFIISMGNQVITAYIITILVTVIGTALSVVVMALYAFPISRKDFKYKNFFTFFLIFTMLFNGGLVSTYLIGVNVLHLKDNLWGLIFPYLMNAFWVIILRTFYRTNIPDSLIESAKIDGAGEFMAFFRIVFPLALPGIATIGLFAMLQYWNDWFLAALYINDPKLVPLAYLLYQVQTSMQYLMQNSSNIGGRAGDIMATMPSEAARMAMVVISVLPIVITFPFFQKYFVKGLTVGAIKG